MAELASLFAGQLPAIDLTAAMRPRGAVVRVGDGIAQVFGLDDVGAEELVQFDSGALGFAYELGVEQTGVVLLRDGECVRSGEGARGLGALPSLMVSAAVSGRVLDPLGRSLDDRPAPSGAPCALFRDAPSTIARRAVEQPLLTGVTVIDAAISIGRGQRQLIVGDRNVGKTALALDIVAAQRASGVRCIYVSVGQSLSRVITVRESLRKQDALANTTLIAADAAASPGLQYLAPFAGMAAAEYFAGRGEHVLIVFDDLTKHADAYRQLALLLGRPPGREAFPGDIFYLHAQLLERATALAQGGSITALPLVETTDGDISSYIPTNLISITDGQIYLDTSRFERGQRPAVDVGRSVSRVGGVAQQRAIRASAKNLRIVLARFEGLEALSRVGLDLDPATQSAVARGRILRELLQQPRFTLRLPGDQIIALNAVQGGWLDGVELRAAGTLCWGVIARLRERAPGWLAALDRGELPAIDWAAEVRAHFAEALAKP